MLPTRILGKTGQAVSVFGLGGEGVLRTTGMMVEAQAVIEEALRQGVTYFDTAPAYADSRDYLGSVFGKLSSDERKKIFIASKTHDRSYRGSIALLQDTLTRLQTDYLDLWQLHDLRTQADIDEIFSGAGAIHALLSAKERKVVRFIGITGHYDPQILIAAMRKAHFDTVLIPVNAADKHYIPFITTVIPVARKMDMGVIAMKVTAQGHLFPTLSMKEAFDYSMSQDVDLAIVGCKTPAEVRMNAKIASEFKPLTAEEREKIEWKTEDFVENGNYFKKESP